MALALSRDDLNTSILTINISDYPGGVAIWGALPAVFDTTSQGFDRGVHVHARLSATSKKSIDQTFTLVNVIYQDQYFTIDEEVAVNFTLASIFRHKIISLKCSNCRHAIVSTQIFSLVPHHEHICNHCGSTNYTNDACVINPVIELKDKLGDRLIQRESVLPKRSIKIDFNKYSDGVQIWGSNPSIIWTAKRSEESAIHVHAYKKINRRVVDNTYSHVEFNRHVLDIDMIRVLQIQQYVPELRDQLSLISCPYCKKTQFDRGIYAVLAQSKRRCQHCREQFTSRSAKISNPAISILNDYS